MAKGFRGEASLNTSERQANIVDLLTRSPRPVSARLIAQRVGVSVATVERDLAAIRRSGVPLVSQAGRAGGVYVERTTDDGGTTATTPAGPGALVGRKAELAQLTALFDSLTAKGLSVALISGDSGVGKTRLVTEFGLTCRARGSAVVHGDPLPGFSPVPLWPWIRALDELATPPAGRPPAEESSSSHDARAFLKSLRTTVGSEPGGTRVRGREFRLFERIASAIAVVVTGPSLIVMDDLQDADTTTLRLLEFVAASRLRIPLLIVAIHNSFGVTGRGQHRITTGALSRLPNVARIRLRPLGREDSDLMIRGESVTDLDDRTVSDIRSHAEGNPLFIRELVRQINAGDEQLASRLPEGVMEVIGRRLDGLSEACLDVLRLAALTGLSFRFDALEDSIENAGATVSPGATRERTRELLDEAAEAGVVGLDVAASTGAFTHGLVREGVLHDISASTSVALHAAIATTLERHGSQEEPEQAFELARHFLGAVPVLGPEPAARYSMMAGLQAMAGFDFRLAESHFDHVLRLGRSAIGNDLYHEARGRLGQATAFTATRPHKQAAVEMLGEAVDYFLSNGQIETAAEFALTGVIPISGGPDEAPTHLSELIASVIPHAESSDRLFGRLLARYGAVLAIERLEFEAASAAASRAREIAVKLKDEDLAVQADRALLAITARTTIPSADSPILGQCQRLIAAALRTGDIDAEMRGRFHLTAYLAAVGPMESAARESARFLERAEEYRETVTLQQAMGRTAFIAVVLGHWGRALELARRDEEMAGPSGFTTQPKYAVQIATGDERALTQIRELVIAGQSTPDQNLAVAAALLLANDDGRREELAAAAESLTSALGGTTHPHGLRELAILSALAAAAARDQHAAKRLYPVLTPARTTASPMTGVHVSRVLARLDHICDRPEDAESNLGVAIDFATKNRTRPELARALVDACRMGCTPVVSGGRLSRSEALSMAAGLATELGMKGLSRQIGGLEPAGHRESPGGLSEREIEILRMVAAGYSNGSIAGRLFITENTVTRHMTNIFAKIGVANRTEAAAFAFRNGVTPV